MTAQGLVRPGYTSVAEVVDWLGAVQAQDYNAARWAVGLRMAGHVTEADIEQAIDDGSVLRTHALRWTWQLVRPADLRWMLQLVGARLLTRAAGRHRQLELDAASFRRSRRALEQALRDGQHCTREELARVLDDAGVSPAGQRLSHLLACAELEGVICSWARRGKQTTHALLELRAPAPERALDRDAALAELATRYFQSRGPASVEDFSWWSGLTKTEARRGIAAIERDLERELLADTTYWRAANTPRARKPPVATLLPAFDEYLVAYRDRKAVLDPAHVTLVNAGGGMLGPCLLLDGRVAGSWRRVLARSEVAIELAPLNPLQAAQRRALTDAAERYAAFLGLTPRIRFVRGALRADTRRTSR